MLISKCQSPFKVNNIVYGVFRKHYRYFGCNKLSFDINTAPVADCYIIIKQVSAVTKVVCVKA